MKRYSRLASVEAKRNFKRAYLYVILSIITGVVLLFIGLPILIKFASFIGTFKKSNELVEIQDTTPPAPPQFDEIVEYTNKQSINITGKTEAGATVVIRANNKESETIADKDGFFSYLFKLETGENSIDARARDDSSNISTTTKLYKISFDNQPPTIEIESPGNGDSFYGSNQRQLVIKGKIDENEAELTINGRYTSVNEDGLFTFAITLEEGQNNFEIKAIDLAGNESSTSFYVNFAT